MKKLILILFLIVACSRDNEPGCVCDLKVQFVQSDGEIGTYYFLDIETDCNGGYDRPPNIPSDHFVSLQNCN